MKAIRKTNNGCQQESRSILGTGTQQEHRV